MEFKKGEVVKGKVTGIAKFGAFVELAPGKSGLVYISEIANTFVKEVSDFLTVGQEVTVKIISIDENGRINLSIKQAEPPRPQEVSTQRQDRGQTYQRAPQTPSGDDAQVDAAFEDKLKRFMKDSDSKMSDIRRQSERRGSRRRRG